MTEEYIAYLNREYLPTSQAKVSVMDWGFCGGDAVYEVVRTCHQAPFRLAEHIDRLLRSARYIRITCELSSDELLRDATELVHRNMALIERDGDVAIWCVLSRGDRRNGPGGPTTLTMYCVPIDYRRFARRYVDGTALVTPSVRRMSPHCVEPKAKLTNRANQLLALFEARQRGRRAVPLMLDMNGFVTETNSSNFFFVSGGRLCTSGTRNILAGVTRNEVMELAKRLHLDVEEGDFTLYDVHNAQEAFTTSTTEWIIPVASVNGVAFPSPVPGPVTTSLQQAWSSLVDHDYVVAALSRLDADIRDGYLSQWRERSAKP